MGVKEGVGNGENEKWSNIKETIADDLSVRRKK